MTKGELKTAILADAHRGDLSGHVDRFIRLGEGLIARRMQGWEVDFPYTLDDTDRVDTSSDLYTLPSGILEIRRIQIDDGAPLHPAGPNFIALKRRQLRPSFYCVLGNRLQVRGVPGEDAELVLDCRGRLEPLSDDSDTNAVLEAHEALYMHSALHYLYKHTQDTELADAELGSFNEVVDDLNAEATRKRNAGAAPAYDFGGGGGY